MIAFGFVNPLLLAFAGLIGVPILIYLWNRQRYRVTPWAAMAFIQSALRQNRRRLRIENLLLLLLRILIVLLLVLAFARPVLEDAGALTELQEGRRSVLVVMDTSFSTSYGGARSSFERERAAALGVLETVLKKGDSFGLILVGEGPDAGHPGGRLAARAVYKDPVYLDERTTEQVSTFLKELEPSFAPGDMVAGLREALQFLPRFERDLGGQEGGPKLGLPKEVFVLTDLQRSSFATGSGLRDAALPADLKKALEAQNARLTVIDCGDALPRNAAVTSLVADASIVGVGRPTLLLATVRSFTDEPLEELTLELRLDGVSYRQVQVELEPGEERSVELYAVFEEAGPHTAEVSLRTDGLTVDNTRYLALDVREAVEVLLVDGEPGAKEKESETFYLRSALSPGAYDDPEVRDVLGTRVVGPGELEDQGLSGLSVVVLANVLALSQKEVSSLETFVREGGGLIVFLGEQTDPKVMNPLLWKDGKGLLPAPLGPVVRSEREASFFRLAPVALDHPVMRPFIHREAQEPPAHAAVHRVRTRGPGAGRGGGPSRSTLLRFEPRQLGEVGDERPDAALVGGPALLERRFGRGRVLLFTSTADNAWSNFFAQYAYLILWHQAVGHLADAGSFRRNLVVGQPFEAILPRTMGAREILLAGPGEAPVEKVPDEREGLGPDRFALSHEGTWRPGFYQVYFRRDREDGAPETERGLVFSASVDPSESDLRRVSAEGLKDLFHEVPLEVVEAGRVAGLGGEGPRAASGFELWKSALVLALALLLTESALACRFGRRAAV